ncbi:DUF2589 domain-containing protein [Halovivax cerinus]|uniref:DUF2589 domain-containing protein n=1 Tax=Halovivax cerinus TaxID=1487865 RepID=A0ABD5NNJ0_9EURY|nr:DUF2589 domain-containing protein [Halovivax cerinus]
MTEELQNLPLSALFSGPLIAAIDASVEAQTETVELLREHGYDEAGNLVTVTFGYTTTESDPAGGTRRVAREIEIPLLLFLSLPNLVIHEIEEEFSAKITKVQSTEAESDSVEPASRHRLTPIRPPRLRVTPSDQETTLDRKTRSTYDLTVRMVAELRNESAGMDRLERVAATATTDRIDEARTEQLAETRREETDGGGLSPVPGRDGTASQPTPDADATAPVRTPATPDESDDEGSETGDQLAGQSADSADRAVGDPSEYTVSELRETVAEVDDIDDARSLLEAERTGRNRKTARRAIERRIEHLRDEEASEE